MYPALATLDPDVAFPARKPQLATDFDPRWAISFYHGCGGGPYALQPYVSRGVVPAMSLGGSATIAPAQDGWAAKASAGGANDYYGVAGTGITWVPSQTLGSLVFAFRAAAASTDSASRIFISYGDSAGGAGSNDYFFFTGSGSALFAGWEGNLTASTVGLWAAGQLVVVVMTYSSAGPQALYVNGALLATSSATPAIGSYTGNANNSVSIAGVPGTANGCEAPILYALFADRAFTAQDAAWIAENPLNWMFMPGPVASAVRSATYIGAGGGFGALGEQPLGIGPTTSTTIITRDSAVPAESLAAIFGDGRTSAEVLVAQRTDWMARLEAGVALNADGAARAESLGSLAVDSASLAEWCALLRADGASPAEILASLARDSGSPTEALVALLADSDARTDWLAGVNTDSRVAVEALNGLSADAWTAVEWFGAVVSDSGARIEFGAGVSIDSRALTESLASLAASAPGPVEFIAIVEADSPAPTESSVLLFADARALVEWLGSAPRRRIAVFMRGRVS